MERRINLNSSLITSAFAILCIVGFVFLAVPKLFGSVFASATGDHDPQQGLKNLLAKHDADQQLYMKRIAGRSLFVKPKPPPPPPPPPRETTVVVQDDTPPPPPPKPTTPKAPATYGGPQLLYPLDDEVYFKRADNLSGYFVVRIGQPAEEGVEVLEIKPPQYIKLAWTKPGHERGEYTINIFSNMKFGGEHKGLSDKFLLANKPQPGLRKPPENSADESTANGSTSTDGSGGKDEDLSDDSGSNNDDEDNEAIEDDSEESDEDAPPPEFNF